MTATAKTQAPCASALEERAAGEDKTLRAGLGRLRVVTSAGETDTAAPRRPEMEVATVLEQDGLLQWTLQLEDGKTLEARRADGCLLLPEKGDTVLALRNPGGQHYVLNVLEKCNSAATLHFQGDVRLSAPQGVCELQGREVALSGIKGRFRFGQLEVLGKKLEARLEETATAVGSAVLAASHVTARIGHALRLTGFELHRAKGVRTEVEGRFSLDTGQTTIKAKDDVTVDGDKIHLG